jgi:rhodanese-related sulfurtransferase
MVQEIGTEEARRLHEADAQFVEVLGKSEFDEEHLPGAIHIPLRRLEERAHEQLDAGRPIVVYCFDYQ